jgi:site-specific DNA-methyltransferase (adenine-specific)
MNAYEKITIDPEFAALIPPLSKEERDQLEANLLEHGGARDALVVWNVEDRLILIDGHNRFEICMRLGLLFDIEEIEFDDRNHAKEWIIRNQFGRRNLSAYVRTQLALRLEETIAARAKANQVIRKGSQHGTIPQISAELSPVETRQEVAKLANVSHDTVAKVKRIDAQAAPELVDVLKAGGASISAAAEVASLPVEEQREIVAKGEAEILKAAKKIKAEKKEARKEQDRQALMEAQAYIEEQRESDLESVCDIRACSCADLFASGIRPDAVITDPPYPREFLPVFTELAQACKDANVPLVAVMSGQSYLPEVMERLCRFLDYRWTLAYMTPGGQSAQQWQAKVNTFWKPVLLFGESIDWLGDVATSKPNDNDKRFHEWGQSESGMADLIERLTKPGQLVCDPFMGGGTTAVVALALGRRFVGCDIDAQLVKQAKERILS